MPYLSNKTKSFLNRVKVVEEMLKPLDQDELTVFLLKTRHNHQFSMDMESVLTCLRFAEVHGVLPPISQNWWQRVSKRVKNDC